MPLSSHSAFRAAWNAFRLSAKAWPLVVEVRLALWREPFAAFHARHNALVEGELSQARSQLQPGETQMQGEPDALARREAWDAAHAVSRAARLMPGASCLTQALVLQRLLARQGQECALRLGVDRPSKTPGAPKRSFQAHAWIEWHGRVLIGGDISRWTPLVLGVKSRD